MRFKDIVEQERPPIGNPNQIGGKNVNPIKKTDVPPDDVRRLPGDRFGKPEGRMGDEIRNFTRNQDAQASAKANQPQPGETGRRIGARPTGGSRAYNPTVGASPAEIGSNAGQKLSKAIPGMDKVTDALRGVDVNKLHPEQKASLINKINDTLQKAGPKLPKRLAGLAALVSAGLELIDPSIAQAAQDAKESFMGESMQINEAPYQVIDLDGNILTAVPQGGEQAIKMDITGWVLEFGQMGPVLRQPKSPVEKDRSLPAGSQVDVQGNPRIIGTPERG